MAEVVLMLILLPNIAASGVTISDVVREDTSFYYRTFSTFPSKLATLHYSVVYNITMINRLCDGVGCTVVLDIHTTEYDKILQSNCSNDGFGQLRNEYLHTQLRLRYRPYRFTACKLDDVDLDMLHCEGRTTIQDYIPRDYGFSFGYECDFSVKPSLVGLWYNFTISGQSNETQCLPLPHHLPGNMNDCIGFYNHMSLPNMVGNPDINSLMESMNSFKIYHEFISYMSSQLPTGGCYKYMNEVLCRIYFPQCNQIGNQVIHICKETCFIFLNSCVEVWKPVLNSYFKTAKFEKWKKYGHGNISDFLDCNYLSTVNDSIPCYYKPVTCDPPPNVTNARIINNPEFNGTYLAMSEVDYECVDETFQMEGNSTVTCLYSGKWYKIPTCLKRQNETEKGLNLNPLSIVIPLLIASFCIFIITFTARRYFSKRNKLVFLKRNREYDAFVCYNFDENRDFVFDSILPELEEKHDPPLKMFIHDRDFTPGRDITINICNAIDNCNSAIIVMSQGFIDSPRCREEFTKCLAESEADAAFRLFIIVMEDINILVNVPENMHIFFKEKTYLKRYDPKLFEKIGNHLNMIKKQKNIPLSSPL